VSATHDAREGGSVSFFPELDQAYNNFLNEHDGARVEAQSAMEIDTSASDSLERLHTTTDEYEKDEDYRISAKQKRRHVIDALESSQESKSYLFHPLYQGTSNETLPSPYATFQGNRPRRERALNVLRGFVRLGLVRVPLL